MTDLFQALAVNSLRGGVLILAILLLRSLFRKTPRRILCPLWSLAALRLILPLQLTAFFGLLPGQTTAAPILTQSVGSFVPSDAAPAVQTTAIAAIDPLTLLSWLWLAGVIALLLWPLIRAFRLRRKLSSAVCQGPGIWISNRISTPFVLGLLFPRIYLPVDLAEDCRSWVLAHEQAHIRRWDTRRKAFGFALMAIYWFNPLCWLGWFAFCRDLELACDEQVTAGLPLSERKSYALALLRCCAPMSTVAAAGFGEKPVRARIQAILRRNNQPRWVSALISVVCVGLIICLCFEMPVSALTSGQAASTAAEPISTAYLEFLPEYSPASTPTPDRVSYPEAWVENFLNTEKVLDPEWTAAAIEALLKVGYTRHELSGSLFSDDTPGSYRVLALTSDPTAKIHVVVDTEDPAHCTVRITNSSQPSAAFTKDMTRAELNERPQSFSLWGTEPDGSILYYAFTTEP